MTQKRLWKGQMEWSWMVEEFVWIILSLREHIHLHQASTWADQPIVAVAVAVVAEVEVVAEADVEILTMIEDMIVDMTDTKTMITGTEEGRLLLIIVDTDHDHDLAPTAQDAIDNGMVAVEDPSLTPFLILEFPKLLIFPTPLKKKKKRILDPWFI